jgi:hypothetical protein
MAVTPAKVQSAGNPRMSLVSGAAIEVAVTLTGTEIGLYEPRHATAFDLGRRALRRSRSGSVDRSERPQPGVDSSGGLFDVSHDAAKQIVGSR